MKARADAAVYTAPDAHSSDVAPVADAAPETPLNAMSDAGPPALSDASVGQDAASSLVDGAAAGTTMATITFRLKNTGTITTYVHRACTIPIRVTSLTDGAVYDNNDLCVCECASLPCPTCGQCYPDSAIPLEAGAATEVSWQARRKSLPRAPYGCVDLSPIPTGAYQVAINVYASESDAANTTDPRPMEQAFTLGNGDATVEVAVR